MTELTPESLAELRRLLDEGEGRDEFRRLPWHAWDRGIGYELHYGEACRDEMTPDGYCDQVNYGQRETFGQRDAALIVAAVNALPALLDAAARLAEVEEAVRRGALCPMCSTGMTRQTVGMVCQLCGTDYGSPEYSDLRRDSEHASKAVLSDALTVRAERDALAAKVEAMRAVHARYFDMDGRPGYDDTNPEPEDVWRFDRDFRAALDATETDHV